MKRIAIIFALCAAAMSCWAMTDDEQDRMVWNHLGDILIEDEGHTAYMYFANTDADGDGIDDLIISTRAARPRAASSRPTQWARTWHPSPSTHR